MEVILGLNAYHADSSACLIIDGKLIAAAEEERFRRIKHWAGFPREAIRYCLAEAGIGAERVQHIAINQDLRANFLPKTWFTARHFFSHLIRDRLTNTATKQSVIRVYETELGTRFTGRLHKVEHHLAHIASAALMSPFEDCAVLSLDGFGDFASTAAGVMREGQMKVLDRVLFPHSLGIFYQAMTQYLGFWSYGDEYKVMGLASYGAPTYVEALRRMIRLTGGYRFELNLDFFRHHRENVNLSWEGGAPEVGALFSDRWEALLGPARGKDGEITQRHQDLAHSAQRVYEEIVFALIRRLAEELRMDDLALAGGCAMNSSANGKIYDQAPIRRLYVQPAAGDAGGALGAALVAWQNVSGSVRPPARMAHAYWGPHFSNPQIHDALERAGLLASDFSVSEEAASDVFRLTAEAIARGDVVGWFRGRMEWGPRALGARSILADPRLPNIRDVLNLKIKRRESFRPFAPAIKAERLGEWYRADDYSPFMMQVFDVRPEQANRIPAVTHVDGTGRVQCVSREEAGDFYCLIDEFERITGIPIVLNTSFNENEPIVCTPEEAINCFVRTRMDMLVLENWVVRRTQVA